MKDIKLENKLLRGFLRMVMEEDECKCGVPPYDNGNPCNACFAIRLLEIIDEKTEYDKKLLDNMRSFKKLIDEIKCLLICVEDVKRK